VSGTARIVSEGLSERHWLGCLTSVVGTLQSVFSNDEGCAAGVWMKLMSFARLPSVTTIFRTTTNLNWLFGGLLCEGIQDGATATVKYRNPGEATYRRQKHPTSQQPSQCINVDGSFCFEYYI